ncbi:hydroxyacylglutathione hydrolase [Vibrio sp.]|nr:hydroxyacylglutathione hydrolase [Vibrio sp.]
MLEILPIPAFNDNYIWLLKKGQHCSVVDPGDATPVLNYLEQHQLTLDSILITHHHHDHTGGVATLLEHFPHLLVFAPKHDPIQGHHIALEKGDHLSILDEDFEVLDVKGHTLGHIAYFHSNNTNDHSIVFCGDTLFSAGCGRVFEGTMAEMKSALDTLASLPDSTLVYCTHEYTLSNIAFALAADPTNVTLQNYHQHALSLRKNNTPTLPTTIAKEKQINPFLRCSNPALISNLLSLQFIENDNTSDELLVFTVLREWKNRF